MKEKIAIIYLITNKVNKKRYVGFTTDFSRRMRNHFTENNKHCRALYSAIVKYGRSNFKVEILHRSSDVQHCLTVMEPKFIKKYKTIAPLGYNITEGGRGSLGRKMSKKCKDILRKAVAENWKDENFRKRKSDGLKSQWRDLEFRKLQSKKAKSQWKDPKFRRSQTKRLREQWNTPKRKKQQSLKAKKLWANPAFRKRQSERMKKQWRDSTFRKAVILRIKANWKNPEFRNKMIIKLNLKSKANWKNPEFRNKMTTRMSKTMFSRWSKMSKAERLRVSEARSYSHYKNVKIEFRGRVYRSMTEAAKHTGTSRNTVAKYGIPVKM